MKKNIKLVLALVLSIMMVLGSMSALADAAVPTAQTIGTTAADKDGKYTISVASGDDHSYKVYQILTGSLIAGESKLGNPQWGSDAKSTGNTGVDDFIESITAANLSNTQINDLVKGQLKDNAAGVGTATATEAVKVDPGFYLIEDITPDANLADGEAKSLNIVAVFNNITITPKTGTTTSEKHVDDVNDSTGDTSKLKDSADYDFGDRIPYTLSFTLPADYANYKKYYVSFVDDMSAGLTYDGNAKIYYGSKDTTGTDIGTDFAATTETSSYTTPSAGKIYRYTINDLKTGTAAQKALVAGDVIKITYTATLNKNAVIGSAGNPNKYKVQYSRNPNESGNGTPETGDTPDDINIAFTYKTVFNKVDGEKKPLTGADFTLYKWVKDESGADTYKNEKGAWLDVTTLNGGDNHPTKATETLTKGSDSAANAKFTFSGIDDGYYKLVESTTPVGYNTLADQYFTITAEHVLVAENPTLTSLTGTDGAQFTMTPNVSEGSLTADIENQKGATLPSTGGIGTTIFYVGGSILVLAAAILLITKRRMGNND